MKNRDNRFFRPAFLPVGLLLLAFHAVPQQPATSKAAANEGPARVLIPGGEFVMGRRIAADDPAQYVDNGAHTVRVDAFYLDKTEVTNAQYLRFCQATNRKLPFFWGMKEFHCGPDFPDFPVVGISWADAKAYAEWRGMRLPTEAEWEYAARGGLVGKTFPTGDDLTAKDANFATQSKGTEKVGSYAANGFGLYDMAGNVGEWVSDFYDKDYYAISPAQNPPGPPFGAFKVVRGGGWRAGRMCNTVFSRTALPIHWVDFNLGFRCAGDVAK
jgi:formylglycine-generating enzyme